MKHLFTRAFPLAALFLIAGWIPPDVSGAKELRADLFPRLRTGQSLRYQVSLTIETHGKTESAIVDPEAGRDRKSTRLNSSHGYISYAVFCLKKKKKETA